MKSAQVILVAGCILVSGYAFANESHDGNAQKSGTMMNGMMMKDGSMSADQTMKDHGKEGESKAVEVGNKICPVSGNPIPAPGEKGAMGEAVKYEYNGKIYNLCCSMCPEDFKKDPEKYSKIAEDEVAKDKMQK